jgi:DNA-binding transcriptional ArsR family regulator
MTWALRGGPDGGGQPIDVAACRARRIGEDRVRLVLLVLADYADKNGVTYPSRDTIACEVDLRRRRVEEALAALVDSGLIVRIRLAAGRGQPPRYQLRIVAEQPTLFDSDSTNEKGPGIPAPLATDGQRKGPGKGLGKGPGKGPGMPGGNRNRNRKPLRVRDRDAVWDALVEAIGGSPETASARGAWNRAASELREIGATPEEIRRRVRRYRETWPKVSLTPNALAKHWSSLDGSGDADLDRRRREANAMGLPVQR